MAKGLSPTQRTLRALRDQGRICGIVERWNQFVGPHGIRQDLFGLTKYQYIPYPNIRRIEMRYRNHNFGKTPKQFPTRIVQTSLTKGQLIIGSKSAYDALVSKIGSERASRCRLESRRFTWCFREPIGA
jgi:hypothetical protein